MLADRLAVVCNSRSSDQQSGAFAFLMDFPGRRVLPAQPRGLRAPQGNPPAVPSTRGSDNASTVAV